MHPTNNAGTSDLSQSLSAMRRFKYEVGADLRENYATTEE
jgi:hypothetical protein